MVVLLAYDFSRLAPRPREKRVEMVRANFADPECMPPLVVLKY